VAGEDFGGFSGRILVRLQNALFVGTGEIQAPTEIRVQLRARGIAGRRLGLCGCESIKLGQASVLVGFRRLAWWLRNVY
jgi:hypothetical protein